MKLSTCINQFFSSYLTRIKGVSPNTIKTYRDTFTLFLPFAARYEKIKIESLTPEHLNRQLILDFLDYLQQERQNTIRTRNFSFAAIKSLAKMIRLMYPEKRNIAENILSIPQKRMRKKLIGYLYPDEVDAILKSVDLKKPLGVRDYSLLLLLYDSGARASEIATLNLDCLDPKKKRS
jgi:site-specific recombinase XerD